MNKRAEASPENANQSKNNGKAGMEFGKKQASEILGQGFFGLMRQSWTFTKAMAG